MLNREVTKVVISVERNREEEEEEEEEAAN